MALLVDKNGPMICDNSLLDPVLGKDRCFTPVAPTHRRLDYFIPLTFSGGEQLPITLSLTANPQI
jgi:hypothetical protein